MDSIFRERWIDRALRHWRNAGFPYPQLDSHEIAREFRLLQANPPRIIFKRNQLQTATTGLRLANSFHPQMWHVRSQQHRFAPIDYFHDDHCLRKALARAPRFWPNRRCWNAQCIRALFRIYASGRVANFRPLAARALIERFSFPQARVLDFCAGFGGRLLGSLTLPRHYIGIDASKLQVQGSRRMLKALKAFACGTAELHHGRAEDLLLTLPNKSVDLVFSSPPFFNTELYSSDRMQSVNRYPAYAEWLAGFLAPVIRQAHRILRPNGFFVINVSDQGPFRIEEETIQFAAPLFGRPMKLRMIMHSRPLQRAATNRKFRSESVLVFESIRKVRP